MRLLPGVSTKQKWKAATEFCVDNGWEFMLITEKELKV